MASEGNRAKESMRRGSEGDADFTLKEREVQACRESFFRGQLTTKQTRYISDEKHKLGRTHNTQRTTYCSTTLLL